MSVVPIELLELCSLCELAGTDGCERCAWKGIVHAHTGNAIGFDFELPAGALTTLRLERARERGPKRRRRRA